MAYKDKDKQREAGRERARRYREAHQKALLSEGVTGKALPERTGVNLEALGIEAVPNGRGGHKLVAPCSKRGKDIKCFADLPLDVQKTIDRMSINKDGTVNQTIKANRTAIAVNYQHLFPGRYHSTGLNL